MLGRLTALTATAVVLVPAAADAASYRVVKATHTSSSSKVEDGYSGSSTVTWKLVKGKRSVIGLQGTGAQVRGIGTVKVRGAYGIDVTTDFPGRCAWTARTGDGSDYAAVAPQPFELLVSPDPRAAGRTLVSFTAVRASLGNGYLGTECSTTITGEPEPEVTSAKSVAPKTFKRERVTLKFKGETHDEGVDYRWSTTFVLERR